MPAIQTDIRYAMAPYSVGSRTNMEEWNSISCLVETAGTIAVAYPVQEGAGYEQVVLFTTGKFRGLVEANMQGVGLLDKGTIIPVCEMGVIAVPIVTGGATKRGFVYWNNTAKGYTDTAAGNVLIPNAEFETTTAAGTIGAIRLRRIPAAPAV